MINLDKVRSSDLWYIIGFIVTDGSLSIDGRHINITSKDREHLFIIRNALLLKNKIGRKARAIFGVKKYSQLQFGDVNFYRYLIELGLTPRKSLTLGKIKVDRLFFADFLRGVIDGDGNISHWMHRTNRHIQWSLRIFSASSKFIDWLNNVIEKEFCIKGRVNAKKKTDRENLTYTLKYGKIATIKILEKIYYVGCLSLKRKFLQAQLCLQSHNKMLN